MTQPLSSAEFSALMQSFAPFEDKPRIAVAVSGGPDSMALLLLTKEWAESCDAQIIALTIDHGLRPGSRAEALQVQSWCWRLGVEHHILTWDGEKPESGLMDAARNARSRLLEIWCVQNNILHLVLAHHADDQAETVLMRFAKGSGIDGLAGMKNEIFYPQIRLLRPLLPVFKTQLIATCDARNQKYVEDPSNKNARFARARLRGSADILAAEGLTPERLNDLSQRARLASEALEAQTDRALAVSTEFDPLIRHALLQPQKLRDISPEIRERILKRILMIVGERTYPPRRTRLTVLVDQIWGTKRFDRRRTLHNCLITPTNSKIQFIREVTV